MTDSPCLLKHYHYVLHLLYSLCCVAHAQMVYSVFTIACNYWLSTELYTLIHKQYYTGTNVTFEMYTNNRIAHAEEE